jgi:cell division protein FtsB
MERVDYSKLNYDVNVEGGNLAPETKPIEDEKQKHIETLSQRSVILESHARDLENQLAESIKLIEDYKALTEERFNKLVALIQKK